MIVSHMNFWFWVLFPDVLSCVLFDGLAYFCKLYLLFIVAVSHHVSSFLQQGSCCDDILDFRVLLIALATLVELCWIKSVMVSLMVSMSSSSRIGFSIRVGIRSSLILLMWHLLLVASWSYFFLSISTSSLMLFVTSQWSLPMLTWMMTVTSVTMSGLFVWV